MILITRPARSAIKTASQIQLRYNAQTLLLPLSEILYIKEPNTNTLWNEHQNIIITSTNALDYCRNNLPNFHSTHQSKKFFGLCDISNIQYRAQNVEDLLQHLSTRTQRYLYFRGESISKDIAKALPNIHIAQAICYRNVFTMPSLALHEMTYIQQNVKTTLVYSYKSAVYLINFLQHYKIDYSNWRFISISNYIAQYLKEHNVPYNRVIIAPQPTQDAMLECIKC